MDLVKPLHKKTENDTCKMCLDPIDRCCFEFTGIGQVIKIFFFLMSVIF